MRSLRFLSHISEKNVQVWTQIISLYKHKSQLLYKNNSKDLAYNSVIHSNRVSSKMLSSLMLYYAAQVNVI